jgi:NADH dehydrogenase
VVLQLRRRARRRLRIVVVDRQRTHGYLPLVQERLCDRLPLPATTLPSADVLASLPDTRFVTDEVVGLDPGTKTVRLGSGAKLRARFIVVALGSVLDPPEAIDGREHLYLHKLEPEFRRAHARLEELLAGAQRARIAPKIAVVGGGISGVELAGELAALGASSAAKAPEVTLVSSGARLVPDLSAGTARAVRRALVAQGARVELGARLVKVEADAIVVRRSSGRDDAEERIECDMAFWAGGVAPAPLLCELPLPRTAAGWLAVGPTLQCFATPTLAQPDIFACGDAVRIQGGEGEWPTMQRAIECLWQAKVVAEGVLALADHDPAYPEGVPPLRPHRLRRTFFYGVSVGAKSYVVYRGLRVHVPWVTPWFRRWLMRQYFARYAAAREDARSSPAESDSSA